jgi:Asp-tRNA(Asn)/Glu-tRNA(Gln) amidotransferase A subunit family amidase
LLFVDSIIEPQLILHPMITSNYLTGTEAIALVDNDGLTLEQVLQDHKERYEQRNNQVKAWVCVDHTGTNDKVLEGPLQGMVIGVKDIICMSHRPRSSLYRHLPVDTKDFPTEYGSAIYRASQPSEDAAAVKLLRFAGASIIGKTVSTVCVRYFARSDPVDNQ